MHRPFRYTLLASSLWFSCGALAQPAGDLPLMPWPQQVEVTQPAGKLVLDHRLFLTLQGDDLGDALPRWRSASNCRPAGRWRRWKKRTARRSRW